MSYTSQASVTPGGGATSGTCGRPGTAASGTLLVAIIQNVYSVAAGEGPIGTITPPAGWVQQGFGTFTTAAGQSFEAAIFSHIEGGSEPANYTWSWAGPASGIGLSGISIYNMGATAFQAGTVKIQGFEESVPITWSASAQTATTQQVLTQIWTSHNGTTQYSGMTRAAASNPASMTPYVASVSPGAVPTRTAATTSSSVGVQGMVGFFAAVPSAPSAPTLQSPVGGVPVDATASQNFTAQYNSTDAADCNAYALRVKLSGGSYVYWNATAGTLTSTTIVWNTLGSTVPDGGQIQVTIPSSVLANGHTYNWSMNTQEAAQNLQGTFAADATFVTQTAPTVTATAPTGTITTTTAPAVTWTESLHAGSVQVSYRVIIESGSYGSVPGSGTVHYDSGTVLGAALTATPDPLDNTLTYRAFVMITQTGPQDSSWSHIDFTISVTPPNTPILTAAPDIDPATGEPRVALTVLGSDSGPLWTHSNTVFEVQVSTDDGSTWVDVRGAGALTPTALDTAEGFDYDSEFGGEGDYYRARTIGTPVNPIISAWSAITVVPLDSGDLAWVRDPLDTSSALQLGIVTDDSRTSPLSQAITPTLGSSQPVVTSDVRQVQQGTFTWVTFTTEDREALIALLNRGRTLIIRYPAEQDQAGDVVYFLPTGPITVSRYAQASLPGRTVATAWIERARP